MKTTAALILTLALPCALHAQQQRQPMRWTAGNVAWGMGASAAIASDCAVTRYGLNQGSIETNVFVGQHPSAGHLNTMCAAAVLGTWGMAHLLPTKSRKWWFGAITAIELGVTVRNLTRLHH